MTDAEVQAAIDVIKAHLKEYWISEGCKNNAAFGCVSCQATRLSADLDELASFLEVEE